MKRILEIEYDEYLVGTYEVAKRGMEQAFAGTGVTVRELPPQAEQGRLIGIKCKSDKTEFEKQIGFEMHEGTVGTSTLWDKYGLSNMSGKMASCDKHDLVVYYLETHPDEAEKYLQYQKTGTPKHYGYYNILKKVETGYCPSCEKLKAENADLKNQFENLNIQAARDIAKGWVSIPEVEWDSVNWDEILKPE